MPNEFIARNGLISLGNVGIGTASPATKLQVDAGSNIATFRSVGAGENNKQIVLSSGGDRSIIGASNIDGSDTALAFNTAGNERLRITSGGNVGIGTASPSTKLDVTGTVTATSFSGAGTGLTGTASSLSIGGNAATATYATQLNGYANQTVYTILDGPANGPVIKVRYDSGTANRYIDIGSKDGNGVYTEGLRLYNGSTMTWLTNVVLHAGNYSSYALPLTGGTLSGNISAANITTGVNVNHIVQRDASGYIYANYINFNTSESENPTINSFFVSNGDGWSRKATVAHVKNTIRGVADGTWGISITGNAATVTNGLTTSNYTSTLDGRYFYNRGFGAGYPSENANTMPENSAAFTYSNNAPLTGCIAYFPASGYGIQLNGDYGGDSFSMRSRNGDNGTFRPWKRLLTDYNYNSYSPTLTGGGASGTWGISITGTASNITAYSINQNLSTTSGPTFGDVYNNGWFRNYGDTGLYNQNYGSHFRRSTSASHGTWEIFGYNKNGYGGLNIIDPSGYWNNFMFENGNGGLYQENGSGWIWYHNRTYGSFAIGPNAVVTASYRLYVEGSIYATGVVDWASDVRKKENIVTIDSSLEKVTKLRGVYFNRIDDPNKKTQTGVIAQEVKEIMPELVNYDDMNDSYSVTYGNFAGLFIEAIKEQQKLIESQQKQIDELKSIVNNLNK